MDKNIKIIHTADWHFGHLKTPTLSICQNIKKFLFKFIPECDLMIIAGDVFDMSVSMNSHDAVLIIGFFLELFNELNKSKVILRIIRGTYSHDRNQLKVLEALYKDYNFSFDFKYIDKIKIETIKSLDIKIGYLPDNLNFNNSNEIIETVKKMMKMSGYSYLDYIVGHGDFDHKYPDNIVLPRITYQIEQFDFVKKYVLMGHNHIPSKYKKVIYSGSFSRLKHNEEGKKGFFYITDKPKFIENKDAMIFKSFDINANYNQEELIKKLNRIVDIYFSNKTKKGYLRIVNCPSEFKQWIYKSFLLNHPNINVTFKKKKGYLNNNLKINDHIALKHSTNLEIPTSANIHILIANAIKKYNFGKLHKNKIQMLLKRV